jgi:hypothetical protein
MTLVSAYDPETVRVIGEALDGALADLESSAHLRLVSADRMAIRKALTLRVKAAVRLGQRDPDKLRTLALEVVGAEAAHKRGSD